MGAALAASLGAVGLSRHAPRWGRRALGATAGLLTVAVAALAVALLRGDWSLTYVSDYTSRDTPWPYRLAALWAGMAGSLLLWTWMLALWSLVAVAWCRRRLPEAVGTVQAVLAVGLAVLAGLLLWATPPFRRLEIPAIDGGGLTPVLRHPAMLYHPLLLYAGQVGLAMPCAVALAARWRSLPAGRWLPGARRFLVVSLALLGVAMVAGAHWAYVELGWGGYWAWDPVENTALLPWLAGLAFLHVARRPAEAGTAASRLLALAFAVGLGGAVLTRSGITASVHAFAEAAGVGRVLIAGLAGVALAWLVVEARSPRPRHPPAPFLSRDGALGMSAALAGGLLAVIGAGTLWPTLRGDGSLVTGRYFALVGWPFALALLALAGVGPRLRGSGARAGVGPRLRGSGARAGADLARRLWPALAAVPAAGLAWWALDAASPLAVATAGLGGATAALTVAELAARRGRGRWRDWGGLVAHLGAAVLLVGVMGTTTGASRTGVLGPGQQVTMRGYTLVLDWIVPVDAAGPGEAVQATVAVLRGGERVATLRPEAMLTGAGQRVSVAGLRSTPVEDLQVTLRAIGPDGTSAVVDVAVLPLVQWVWWGGLLVAAGLALVLVAPASRTVAPTMEPVPFVALPSG